MTQNKHYTSFWQMDIDPLVEEIVRHESAFGKYKENFREQLSNTTPTFPNNHFYCPIEKSNKSLGIETGGCAVSISLDGLLLNNVIHQTLAAPILNPIEQYGLSSETTKWDNFINGIKKRFTKEAPRGYSIHDVVYNLLNRQDVIEALWSEPPAPYILLGSVKTIQHDSSSGVTQIGTRPTLIKPQLDPKYESLIRSWEYSNEIVTTDKDKKILGLSL